MAEVGTNFADKRLYIGLYSSFTASELLLFSWVHILEKWKDALVEHVKVTGGLHAALVPTVI
jgi:hypothetical protein